MRRHQFSSVAGRPSFVRKLDLRYSQGRVRFREGYPPLEGWGCHVKKAEGGMRAKGKREDGHQKEAPSWKDKVGSQRDTEDGLKSGRGRMIAWRNFLIQHIMFHPSQTPVDLCLSSMFPDYIYSFEGTFTNGLTGRKMFETSRLWLGNADWLVTGEGDCGPIQTKAKITIRGTLSLSVIALFSLNMLS